MSLLQKVVAKRHLSFRFGMTAADQCVSSISNFAVGVAVARIAGVANFGRYSLVYAVWLVIAAFHRSLITEPMSIENDIHKSDAAKHVRAGLSAELWIGTTAACFFFVTGIIFTVFGNRQFGDCFLTTAPFLPFLLAQDYWRQVGFMKARPRSSLANDSLFLAIQLVAFGVLLAVGLHSVVLAIVAWGLGAVGSGVYGIHQFATGPTFKGGLGRIRSRWKFSRWLVGVDVISSTQSQTSLLLIGGFLGPVSIGGFKAASNLISGPSLVLLQTGGNVGLPEAAKQLKNRGWSGLRLVERVITAAAMVSVGIVTIVVFVRGRWLLVLLYGPEFGRFSRIADILATGTFLVTATVGANICLKATKQTSHLFVINVLSLVASVIAVVILAPLFGIAGAAVATVIGSCITGFSIFVLHLRNSRREAERLTSGSAHSSDLLPEATQATAS